jgi:hypothetical protein
MHGNVINVFTNVHQTQSILPVYHMMMQQYVCFLGDVLNTNCFICHEMFVQNGDDFFMRFN